MSTSLDAFLTRVRSGEPVEFGDTMGIIAEHYEYRPIRFCNGIGESRLVNDPGVNEGSCRIFYFARMHGLSPVETLALFGEYHRTDVLKDPNGQGHQNIRRFMKDGWEGVEFAGEALVSRTET